MKTTLIAALLATIALGASAQAPAPGTNTPGIDKREARQERRIQQGVNSGELTAKETHRLDKQQQHIDNMENRAEADGSVTAKERARIHHAQDRASADIRRKKHNERKGS
jgi:hypothetical protein